MKMKTGGAIGAVILGIIVQMIPGIVAADLGIIETIGNLIELVGWIAFTTFLYMGRQKIAAKYGVNFGICPDLFFVCCCEPCALVQEFKVVELGAAKVGEPVAVGKPEAGP